MRIAIFGTGGVGGYFGGRLAQAGEDVTFIARGENLRAIQTEGLKVDSPTGDFIIHPAKVSDSFAEVGAVDLVIVSVKAWQVTDAALAMKSFVLPTTAVLPLQNGVDAVPQLIAELGHEAVIGGLCKIVSFIVGPGHIRHAGFTPSIVIGEADNRKSDRVLAIADALIHAGVEATIATDIDAALWTKFLFIASFSGVGAIANVPAGVLRSNPELRAQMVAAMKEIYALAQARGVRLPPDAIDIALAGVETLPFDATSSMQRDIGAGRPSELESQNGAVVRMAKESGVAVPTHELIYAKLKPLEEKARARFA
jgi:2-dehydropantoate 2-reductase